MKKPPQLCTKQIAVCHHEESTREELLTFVQCGCKVVDVIVDILYGELHGLLMQTLKM